MKDESKKCFRCVYFDRYYVKGAKRFNRINYGHCSQKIDSVTADGYCDSFLRKAVRKNPKSTLLYNLRDILAEIKILRELYEAQISENEEL